MAILPATPMPATAAAGPPPCLTIPSVPSSIAHCVPRVRPRTARLHRCPRATPRARELGLRKKAADDA
eukprot:7829164-Pyramimonas_sp.AAC.1